MVRAFFGSYNFFYVHVVVCFVTRLHQLDTVRYLMPPATVLKREAMRFTTVFTTTKSSNKKIRQTITVLKHPTNRPQQTIWHWLQLTWLAVLNLNSTTTHSVTLLWPRSTTVNNGDDNQMKWNTRTSLKRYSSPHHSLWLRISVTDGLVGWLRWRLRLRWFIGCFH